MTRSGRLAEAERKFDEAARRLRQIGDAPNLGALTIRRATLDARQGAPQRALRRLRQALATDTLRATGRVRAQIYVALLLGDATKLPEGEDVDLDAARALITGHALPDDTPPTTVVEFAALDAARRR